MVPTSFITQNGKYPAIGDYKPRKWVYNSFWLKQEQRFQQDDGRNLRSHIISINSSVNEIVDGFVRFELSRFGMITVLMNWKASSAGEAGPKIREYIVCGLPQLHTSEIRPVGQNMSEFYIHLVPTPEGEEKAMMECIEILVNQAITLG